MDSRRRSLLYASFATIIAIGLYFLVDHNRREYRGIKVAPIGYTITHPIKIRMVVSNAEPCAVRLIDLQIMRRDDTNWIPWTSLSLSRLGILEPHATNAFLIDPFRPQWRGRIAYTRRLTPFGRAAIKAKRMWTSRRLASALEDAQWCGPVKYSDTGIFD